MEFLPTDLPDVVLIKPRVFGDARGFFMETWEANVFAASGLDIKFVQDNHSLSVKNTLRGLHYQIQHPQGKLVRVVAGEVFDVAVDLRRSSPSFGKWVGMILSAENKQQLWVPPGFAHGFLVLSDTAEFVYKCTDYYAPQHERTLFWNDPEIGIEWPLSAGQVPLLSDKDRAGKRLPEAEVYP
ncbi:MAG: dTDP-4-dehydrorhamnose 3,5-epimerase [Acidobacteriota bacterium]|nr:dTDP-4-dehydrorhamnose 3,5-epimerase [Acidobacteriota bacterium]